MTTIQSKINNKRVLISEIYSHQKKHTFGIYGVDKRGFALNKVCFTHAVMLLHKPKFTDMQLNYEKLESVFRLIRQTYIDEYRNLKVKSSVAEFQIRKMVAQAFEKVTNPNK